jgi:quinol monooxygenase YgiN
LASTASVEECAQYPYYAFSLRAVHQQRPFETQKAGVFMSDRPFTALVEFQIRAENTDMDGWLSVWNPRGEDALVGEPETSAYATAVNTENELNVLVFERYAGESSLQQHMERPAHAELMTALGERNLTKRRVMSTSFEDVPDFGWWSRPEKPGGKDVILVVLGMRFADDESKNNFLGLSAEHAAYCLESEPDTLIYSGGIAKADADRELDIKSGDLIFVMGCTDMAAVEKHRDDPNHLALGARFQEKGVTVEMTFHRTYVTSGHGYLWRQNA